MAPDSNPTLAAPLAAGTAPGLLSLRVGDWLRLTKARANVAVVATAVVGLALHAEPGWTAGSLLGIALGTSLLAAGASITNQAMEWRFDRLMARTRERPIASGRLGRRSGFLLGAALGVAGCLLLAVAVNAHAMFQGVAAYLVYVAAYTPLKRISPLCTPVGAVSGALPLLIGWAAAGGGPGVWTTTGFCVLYLWQIPHFLAIAWWRREDYVGAGYRVLPRNDPSGGKTSGWALAGAVAALAMSLAPVAAGHAGTAYGLGTVLVGGWFCARAVRFRRSPSEAEARRLFRASLAYLPAQFALMLLLG
jgi:protoheme IX farnesyltransferase